MAAVQLQRLFERVKRRVMLFLFDEKFCYLRIGIGNSVFVAISLLEDCYGLVVYSDRLPEEVRVEMH